MPVLGNNNTKACTKCKQHKEAVEFGINKARPDGLHYTCKKCMSDAALKRFIADPEKHRDKKRKYYAKNPQMFNNNPEKRREWHLKKSYGLTSAEYNNMSQQQNHCCAICENHVSLLKRGLVIDHDHQTNLTRGLLCDNCNKSLGLLKDSIKTLERAIEYLKFHQLKLKVAHDK